MGQSSLIIVVEVAYNTDFNMMRGFEVLMALLLVTGANAGVWNRFVSDVSNVFANIEEATYEVISVHEKFEERSYPARKWVCTSITGATGGYEDNHMFMKLFEYITGANSRGESIPMTAPVTTEFTQGTSDTNTYTMCFFLGEAHQENPPVPEDTTVFIQDRTEMKIFTRTVPGYMHSESMWMDEAAQLAEIVQGEGLSVSLNHMFWVGYDSPYHFWLRRNEVWLLENKA